VHVYLLSLCLHPEMLEGKWRLMSVCVCVCVCVDMWQAAAAWACLHPEMLEGKWEADEAAACKWAQRSSDAHCPEGRSLSLSLSLSLSVAA